MLETTGLNHRSICTKHLPYMYMYKGSICMVAPILRYSYELRQMQPLNKEGILCINYLIGLQWELHAHS